ncbi:M56 family metallopeptidase [Lipingzhangella sp. LS1_29]|uniref:M56 family metallopeptidase n=1 Tax=Lipingzhangella rawalii TaxID=2055835 RepID=A0ABU2H7C4_9ACTN|nr:M56 family metallopeptidase [Lipingzhangella rawalii]MDS1270872.1 M56 family metallopeptidase [Lipingzhangella rawalii]
MTTALLLGSYLLLAGSVLVPLLARAVWTQHTPRLALWLWHLLTGSLVLAAVLLGLALAMPRLPESTQPTGWFHACVLALQLAYTTPGGAALATLGLALAGLVLARACSSVLVEWYHTARQGRDHRQTLSVVGWWDERVAATVVEHATPVAYCLPGRTGDIVLSTAALQTLDDSERAAVLAHERAHLRGRHDLHRIWARGLERAFGCVAVFATGRAAVDRLTELVADDAGSRANGPLTVASAVLRLAQGNAPATGRAAAAAAGTATAARVRRLMDGPPPLSPWRLLVGALVVVVPAGFGIAAVTGSVLAGLACCPVH